MRVAPSTPCSARPASTTVAACVRRLDAAARHRVLLQPCCTSPAAGSYDPGAPGRIHPEAAAHASSKLAPHKLLLGAVALVSLPLVSTHADSITTVFGLCLCMQCMPGLNTLSVAELAATAATLAPAAWAMLTAAAALALPPLCALAKSAWSRLLAPNTSPASAAAAATLLSPPPQPSPTWAQALDQCLSACTVPPHHPLGACPAALPRSVLLLASAYLVLAIALPSWILAWRNTLRHSLSTPSSSSPTAASQPSLLGPLALTLFRILLLSGWLRLALAAASAPGSVSSRWVAEPCAMLAVWALHLLGLLARGSHPVKPPHW
jgi:hypothetical protein